MEAQSEIQNLINIIEEKAPRIELALLPTPLHRLPGISLAYGADIFIKRDDMTGIEFGGNKTRKLEYVLPELIEAGVQYLVTGASVQSNWCRQVAAAAARKGLKTILYLFGPEEPGELRGNLLLDKIMGSEVHFIKLAKSETLYQGLSRTEEIRRQRIDELEKQGHRSQYIVVGAPVPKGHVAYISAMAEMTFQLQAMGMSPDFFDYIVTAIGAGGTYAGLSMAKKLFGMKSQIYGFCTSSMHPTMVDDIIEASKATSDFLGMDLSLKREDIHVDFDYGGEYDVPTSLSTQAIKMVASSDAVFLDPVYSAKAMSGLLNHLKKGIFSSGSRILFWHTGGLPALFSEEKTAGCFSD